MQLFSKTPSTRGDVEFRFGVMIEKRLKIILEVKFIKHLDSMALFWLSTMKKNVKLNLHRDLILHRF